KAMTFPELLGRRFDSRFIQWASGLVIFLGMPLYASVVLIGAARFIETTLAIDFDLALFIYSVIIAGYVIWGGLRAAMYTDAMQGAIMLVGTLSRLIMAYAHLEGVVTDRQALTDMAHMVPATRAALAHLGWTAVPAWGSPRYCTMIS